MIAKRMMKKLLSILAAIIICMGTATCVQAADANGFDIEGGVLTGYEGSGGDITIPAGVTSIDEYVFSENADITSVVISSDITSIGDSAFQECSNLQSVTIKGADITIGTDAFNGCSSLNDITIESTTISIGTNAFNRIATNATFTVQNANVRIDLISAGVSSDKITVAGNTPTPTPNPGNGSGSGSGGGSGLPNTSAEDGSHFHLIVFCSLAALTACTYGLKRRFSDV